MYGLATTTPSFVMVSVDIADAVALVASRGRMASAPKPATMALVLVATSAPAGRASPASRGVLDRDGLRILASFEAPPRRLAKQGNSSSKTSARMGASLLTVRMVA